MRNPVDFLFYGGVMEKYNKPPLSYDKQIDLLVSRGLVVADRVRLQPLLDT